MKRAWGLAAAGIAMLVLLGWSMRSHERTDAPQSGDTRPAARSVSAAAEPASVLVELLLLPAGKARAVPASVRIGLGDVSPDQAARAMSDRDAGPAADAVRYSDLAIPTRWIAAPARMHADGSVRVGPMRVPRADRYTLQARGEDALQFYLADFTAGTVPTTVPPIIGAGMRAHVAVNDAGILLRRTGTSASPAVWQRLQQSYAPQLLEAFSEQPVPVADRQVLAPFAPGPVEIILVVGGVEAERRQVVLQPGRITDIHFDSARQAVARAASVDLELEFVRKGDGRPVPGLQVDWLSGRAQQRRTSDARGRVLFAGIDRQQAHQFSLHAIAPGNGLPEWPERMPLEVSPEAIDAAVANGRILRHRVALAPLQWLMARLPADMSNLRPAGRSPYPIHVLQRLREGRWTDAAADHFIPTREGLAVSIAEPGTYRIVSILSPWRLLESSAAEVKADARQSVEFTRPRGSDVTVTVLQAGRALSNTPIQVIGPIGGLPPEQLQTDAGGRVKLAAANVQWIQIEAPGTEQVVVRLIGAQVAAELGPPHSD
jgi:hypothetical protein